MSAAGVLTGSLLDSPPLAASDPSALSEVFSAFVPAFIGALLGSLTTWVSAVSARRRDFSERVHVGGYAFDQAADTFLLAVVKTPADQSLQIREVLTARNTATMELSRVSARYEDWQLPRQLRTRLETGPLGWEFTDDWDGLRPPDRDARLKPVYAELAVVQSEFAQVSRGVLKLRRKYRR
jgi:hypothetical protein